MADGAQREPEQDRRLERRLERAELRIAHLEAQVEQLQDALYRQARRRRSCAPSATRSSSRIRAGLVGRAPYVFAR